MSTAALDDRQPPPSRWSTAVFITKVCLLRLRRHAINLRSPVRRHPLAHVAEYPHVLAEHRSRLWSQVAPDEVRLEQGKVQNLRSALRFLDGAEVPSGEEFSFWAQIGKATTGKGYVAGRQLQEGCLIPAVGGGLCQLSNALYDVAIASGCEITERHPHTRVIPGSAAARGKDATVAWNHIDLRFKARSAFLIEAKLTSDELIVRVRAKEPRRSSGTLMGLTARPKDRSAADSCETCGMDDCFQHAKIDRSEVRPRSAYLLDECWPELAKYVAEAHGEDDILFLPVDGARWNRARYAWPMDGYADVRTATFDTLVRAWRTRRLAAQGPARRAAEIDGARSIARAASNALRPDVARVTLSQALLPFLWSDGHLGGRQFEVLMTRLPMREIQARLDLAMAQHPDRKLLGDFRADPRLVALEWEALEAAERIVTPHRAIAALFPEKTELLEWSLPNAPQWTPGSAVLFPGPTAARKGAYELREVARELRLEIVLLGSELEGEGFWRGVQTRRIRMSDPWQGVGLVVQPAIVEDRPRALLHALAAGVPIVASQACGVPASKNVSLVDSIDEASLKVAILSRLTAASPVDSGLQGS